MFSNGSSKLNFFNASMCYDRLLGHSSKYGVGCEMDASADLKRIQRWLSAQGVTCVGSVGRPEGSLFTGKQNCPTPDKYNDGPQL